MIAALFVDAKGVYANLPDVDVWSEKRDARMYPGPHSVVAHPPCSRWCRLAGLVEARYGHRRGEDGGCFAAALKAVRTWGGVLEHPAYSDAWIAFQFPEPNRGGGWQRGLCGGWSCHVEQGRYGHRARKATWLYAAKTDLPAMRWGATRKLWPAVWHHDKRQAQRLAYVSWCANNGGAEIPRIGKKEASATPLEFRDVLIGMARSAHTTQNNMPWET